MAKEMITTVYGHFLVRLDQDEVDRRAEMEKEFEQKEKEKKAEGVQLSEAEAVETDLDGFLIADCPDVPSEKVFSAAPDCTVVEAGDEVIVRSGQPPMIFKKGSYLYYMYPERTVLAVIKKGADKDAPESLVKETKKEEV